MIPLRRRLGSLVAGSIALFAIAFAIYDRMSRHRLDGSVAAMRATVERFDRRKPLAAEQNAAPPLVAALALLDGIRGIGVGIAASDKIESIDDVIGGAAPTPEVVDLVTRLEPVFALIDQAIARPGCEFALQERRNSGRLVDFLVLSKLLLAQAQVARSQRDSNSALLATRRIFALVHTLRDGETLLCQLTRIMIVGGPLKLARDLIQESSDPIAALSMLEIRPVAGAIAIGIRGECMLSLDKIAESHDALIDLTELARNESFASDAFARTWVPAFIARPYVRFALADFLDYLGDVNSIASGSPEIVRALKLRSDELKVHGNRLAQILTFDFSRLLEREMERTAQIDVLVAGAVELGKRLGKTTALPNEFTASAVEITGGAPGSPLVVRSRVVSDVSWTIDLPK